MAKFTSLSERSQQRVDATKKTTNPDELSDEELLGHANRLEGGETSFSTSRVNDSKKTPSHNREENKGTLTI